MYELRWTKNVIYDQARPDICMLDLCEPATDEQVPLFIFFHGGGLCEGTHQIIPALTELAQKHGVAVASAAYRMYPHARYPDYIEDAAGAVAYLAREYDIQNRFSSVFVGGSSAGGYLSMMLFFDGRYLQSAGVDSQIITGWIFDAGQPTTHFRVLEERGLDGRLVRVDEAAPLWYVDRSYQGRRTPPLMILAADHDMVNRLEQNVVLKTALTHFDYPEEQIELRVMEGYLHCQYDSAQDAEGRYLFADIIADFIRRRE